MGFRTGRFFVESWRVGGVSLGVSPSSEDPGLFKTGDVLTSWPDGDRLHGRHRVWGTRNESSHRAVESQTKHSEGEGFGQKDPL